jgi:serine/threonine-protein kinase
MILAAGTKLGPYEILSKLGEGGMGDVYKARDTRLDRIVAIKIVRTDFTERFQREAKSISALNHPNICTLHDVGRLRAEGASASQGDEVSFLVMEFIDGAPISGPLPLSDVIRYGIQICDALDAAHRAGIVHRDLKPANVLATKSGIKLLDFGLAKLQVKPASDALGTEATVAALTGAHTIVGTPQYMAPEQIEGRDADARTDIFALGCVLYELITGKRAFEGKTASNVLAAVLATEPRKISDLAPITPPALERIVSRCLEKDPDARWQSARDVSIQLKWLADYPEELAPGSGRIAASRGSLITGLAIGAVVAGLAVGGWFWWRLGSTTNQPGAQVNLALRLPEGVQLGDGTSRQAIAVSPDGRMVAFAGVAKDVSAIYLRLADSFESTRIAGTEGGRSPFFSPDGRWVAFFDGTRLKKIPVGGGVAVEICAAPSLRGAAWLPDDTIVYSPSPTGGLKRVHSNGGTPTTLTTLNTAQKEKTHRTLIGLPGGKAVVFVVGSNEIGKYDDARIVALTLDTGKVTELVRGGYAPVYSPTGHLLYVHDSTVFAVAFDPATLAIGSSPIQVLRDVATQPSYGTAEYDVSPSGVLVFVTGGNQSERDVFRLVDRKGNLQDMPVPEGHYINPKMSPDGRHLSMVVGGANNVLMTWDLERGVSTRLTYRFDVEDTAWTADGRAVTYWSGTDLRTIDVDGSGKEEVLISAADAHDQIFWPHNWSDDGETLSLEILTPGRGTDIAVYSRQSKKVIPVASTRFEETSIRLSPDSQWVAYASDESGRRELYLRQTDGSGGKTPLTSGGGFVAEWTKRGRELVYATPNGVLAVPFSVAGKVPVLGKPERLFGTANFDGAVDVSPRADGERFAVLFRKPLAPTTEVRVILNWIPK